MWTDGQTGTDRQEDRQTNSLIPFKLNRALLWRSGVIGDMEMYLRLHVKCLIFLPDCNKTWVVWANCHKSL